MVKERPILFSTPMVQALLNGTKTQTRRTKELEVINNYPDAWACEWVPQNENYNWLFTYFHTGAEINIKCPYGVEGDRLWVRESFVPDGHSELGYIYKADLTDEQQKSILKALEAKWKPSIHMPRVACRLLMEIVSIRVERLQEISEGDAVAEGILIDADGYNCFDYGNNDYRFITPELSYGTLWAKINGPESWHSNPWVWVVEFKRIDPQTA